MWGSNAVCTIYSKLRTFFKSILIILVMWTELGGSGCMRIFWEARFASICNLLNDSKKFCSITDWCLTCCSSLLILLFLQVVNLLQQVWWRSLWLQNKHLLNVEGIKLGQWSSHGSQYPFCGGKPSMTCVMSSFSSPLQVRCSQKVVGGSCFLGYGSC